MIQILAIAAVLLAPAPAAAKPAKCLPAAAVRDMAIVAMPHVVESLAERCRAHLPADAFLTSRGSDFAGRVRGEAGDRVAGAAAAIRAMAGGDMPKLKNDAAFVAVAAEMAGTMVTDKIKPESCAQANSLVQALSPLPAENIGTALASIIALGTAGDKTGPRICPDG
jgi:hypothetical protein